MWLFHFWGDLYGEMLAELLQAYFPAGEEEPLIRPHNEFCLRLPFPFATLPAWDDKLARVTLRQIVPQMTPFLELGRYHDLLPLKIAFQTVIAQCDLPRFEQLYRKVRLVLAPSKVRERLQALT